jgi:hypothetical protein
MRSAALLEQKFQGLLVKVCEELALLATKSYDSPVTALTDFNKLLLTEIDVLAEESFDEINAQMERIYRSTKRLVKQYNIAGLTKDDLIMHDLDIETFCKDLQVLIKDCKSVLNQAHYNLPEVEASAPKEVVIEAWKTLESVIPSAGKMLEDLREQWSEFTVPELLSYSFKSNYNLAENDFGFIVPTQFTSWFNQQVKMLNLKNEKQRLVFCEKHFSDDSEPPQLRWGDYSDSENEFSVMLNTCLGSSIEKEENSLLLPNDMELYLRPLYDGIKKWCEHRKWSLHLSATDTFQSSGFPTKITSLDGMSDSLKKIEKKDVLQGITTLHAMFACLNTRPDVLVNNDKTDTVGSYVMSIIYQRKKLADEGSGELSKISLKNTDAGRSVLLNRLTWLFPLSQKPKELLWNAFHKMLNSMIDNELVDEDVIDDMLASYADRCFTSLEGMLANCYKVVIKTETIMEESKDSRNRVVAKKKQVRRTGRDIPKLTLNRAPVTIEESTLLTPYINTFNNFEEVAKLAFDKMPANTFAKAAVAKVTVDLAYIKVSPIRRLIKKRKDAIRQEALSGSEKKITNITWLAAQAKVLKESEKLGVDVTKQLSWDVDEIVSKATALLKRINR